MNLFQIPEILRNACKLRIIVVIRIGSIAERLLIDIVST